MIGDCCTTRAATGDRDSTFSPTIVFVTDGGGSSTQGTSQYQPLSPWNAIVIRVFTLIGRFVPWPMGLFVGVALSLGEVYCSTIVRRLIKNRGGYS